MTTTTLYLTTMDKMDDCVNDAKECNGEKDDWGCCSCDHQCLIGQGDCDSDHDCKDDLVCGSDNCRDTNPNADPEADCCEKMTTAVPLKSHVHWEVEIVMIAKIASVTWFVE